MIGARLSRVETESVCVVCRMDVQHSSNLLITCDHCHNVYHQHCHVPAVEEDLLQRDGTCFYCAACVKHASNGDNTKLMMHNSMRKGRRLEQAVSGVGINIEQKRSYLLSLSKQVLVNLVLACDSAHPELPLFPESLRHQAMADAAAAAAAFQSSEPLQEALHPSEHLLQHSTEFSTAGYQGVVVRHASAGRKVPRDVNGQSLPPYEELIIQAVQALNEYEGSQPKHIFEWISTHYSVSQNFRPSCSQALQKAYRRGRLEKCGKNYRLAPGALEAPSDIILMQTRLPERADDTTSNKDS